LHTTELGFWKQLKDALLALLQCVPDEPNTLVVLESTANGIGDEYHTRWQEVYAASDRIEIIPNIAWKSKSSSFVAIFISWLIDDEYTKPFENDEERIILEQSLTETENVLMKRGATLEHLNWRRFTVKDKCGNDEFTFAQEYPSTPEEAFLVSGRPVFDIVKCQMNLEKARNRPFRRGDLVPVYDLCDGYYEQLEKDSSYYALLRFMKGVYFYENPNGYIKLYKDIKINPNEDYRFAGGFDVAEGLEQGDYSAGAYLDRTDMQVALSFHGHIDADALAVEQHKISWYLRFTDYVCTERNNHGLTTITHAYNFKLKQYYQRTFTAGYDKGTEALGFKTTQQTKPIVINDLNEYMREDLFTENEPEAIGENMTFVKNARGQMQAQGKDKDPAIKCFDDRVISRALMIHCHKWMPNYYIKSTEQPKKPTGRQEAVNTNAGEAENYAGY
jgi:hypothetical protein